MVYDIKIVNYQTSNDKVIYTICVTDTVNSKFIKYRYSELKQIHTKLNQLVNKLQLAVQLPDFAKRRLFGCTNKSIDAILERKSQLDEYLSKLIILEKLYNLEYFRKCFLLDQFEQINFLKRKDSGINALQMFIDRYTIVQDSVIYYGRFKDSQNHDQWVFKYRYSDFRNIHDALEKSKVEFLPQFPKRKLFGLTKDNPQDIQKRRYELERYFNEIFSLKQLMGHQVIKFFIEDTKQQADKEPNRKNRLTLP